MNTFVTIGTLNPHTHQVFTIFISKFKHEHIKELQNLFKDKIISVVFNRVGCITQKCFDKNHIVS